MNRIVTIDGPASSGKSTVGFQVAQRLSFQFIDSGSIYRAGCHYLLQNGFSTDDDEHAARIFSDLDIRFHSTEREQRIFVFDEDVTPYLGTEVVTAIVPLVGGRKHVREVVRQKQRELGLREDTVMTGRDIGTEIFPDAQAKYFITASPEVRAQRRFTQLSQEGQSVNYQQILDSIVQRDNKDATREVSPFRMPENAWVIDTSELTIEAAVNKMYHHTISNLEVSKEGQFMPQSKERQ